MKNLTRRLDAFDLLFKNLFDEQSFFAPLQNVKISHPVDIYETEKGLNIEVAGTGLTKEDIEIEIQGDSILISHNKDANVENLDRSYLYKGISKRSFNLAYRVSNKFNLHRAEAEMENGLLKIEIPLSVETVTKTLTIK
jgi:HSP20 family protein